MPPAATTASQTLSWVDSLFRPTAQIVLILIVGLVVRFLLNRLWIP